MLKIVLLGDSRGRVSSRSIEQACRRNVTFIALSGDSSSSYTHIAMLVVAVHDSASVMNMRPDAASDPRYDADARKHADNARGIAEDLAQTAQCG